MPEENTASAPANNPFNKPVLSWKEFWHDLIGVPTTTASKLYAEPNAPRFFLIGRHRYIKLDDALAWLETMAATRPYTPRKNKRGASHE